MAHWVPMLSGEGDESPPAHESTSEGEEGVVDVVADLPADPRTAKPVQVPVQVGERAFRGTALGAPSGAVPGAASGDQRLHVEGADEAAVLVVVVAAVTEHDVRAAPGRPRVPRTGGTTSSSGMSWETSLRLPPVRVTVRGMPVASVIRWCSLSALPRPTGLRSVLGPPLAPECENRRPLPGRSPGRSRRAASPGASGAAGATRRRRSTRPSGATSLPPRHHHRHPHHRCGHPGPDLARRHRPHPPEDGRPLTPTAGYGPATPAATNRSAASTPPKASNTTTPASSSAPTSPGKTAR